MAAPSASDGGASCAVPGGDEAREAAAARVRERLAAAEGERRLGAETRRAAAAAAADPRESVAAFAERADARRIAVEGELAALEAVAAAAAAPDAPPPDAAAARARAETVRATLQDFEQVRPSLTTLFYVFKSRFQRFFARLAPCSFDSDRLDAPLGPFICAGHRRQRLFLAKV